jgi:hypothetical protein
MIYGKNGQFQPQPPQQQQHQYQQQSNQRGILTLSSTMINLTQNPFYKCRLQGSKNKHFTFIQIILITVADENRLLKRMLLKMA